jgi:hypothetical protein
MFLSEKLRALHNFLKTEIVYVLNLKQQLASSKLFN